MNLKLTLNQKRFLIVWICFHSFALFVNIADIRGEMPPDDLLSTPNIKGFWPFSDYVSVIKTFADNIDKGESRVFKTASYKQSATFNPDDYHPYVDTLKKGSYSTLDVTFGNVKETHSFNGIFSSYGYSEFIFYLLLGFAIIYVPKLWNE